MVFQPSALHPRTRVKIAVESPSEYNQLYAEMENLPVWQRLTMDAKQRQTKRKNSKDRPNMAGPSSSSSSFSSGFTSNLVDTFARSQQNMASSSTILIPINELHPMEAKRLRQQHPVEFMAAIRPASTRTMNQTMRMMGTYETDLDQARRFKIQVPETLLRQKAFFHPDVQITNQDIAALSASSVKVHPKWKSAETSGHFQYVRTSSHKEDQVKYHPQQRVPGEMEVKGYRRQPQWQK